MDGDVPGPESGLIDLTEVPLDQLRALDDSVLSAAIRRKLRELDEAPEVLAAFDNSISSSPFPGTN